MNDITVDFSKQSPIKEKQLLTEDSVQLPSQMSEDELDVTLKVKS